MQLSKSLAGSSVVRVDVVTPPPDCLAVMTGSGVEEEVALHLLSLRGADPCSTARFPPADVVAGRGSVLPNLQENLAHGC